MGIRTMQSFGTFSRNLDCRPLYSDSEKGRLAILFTLFRQACYSYFCGMNITNKKFVYHDFHLGIDFSLLIRNRLTKAYVRNNALIANAINATGKGLTSSG